MRDSVCGAPPAPYAQRVIGWCADFLRLLWGLIYWNGRKSWYRFRRGASPCPCQSPSDSGRALETQCEACLAWRQPGRFRRVCPLLTPTPRGLRCGADTAEVRPFWGRALAWYGGALLTIYLAAVVGVFAFLRTIGYPVNLLHVGLPPLWPRVVQARGWFFLHKSNLAFAHDRIPEGLLYLANAYDFDPGNYAVGLSLAKHLQVGQPARSDEVFQRLLRDHPGQRHPTAQEWFRALLARGSFERIASLARDELAAGSPHSAVWMRAFVFATRRLPSERLLQEFIADPSPALKRWQPILAIELPLRAGQTRQARAALDAPWPADAPEYGLFYRVNALTELGDTFAALDLLARYPGALDDEATLTLRLASLAAGRMRRPWQQEVDRLLTTPVTATNLTAVKVLCAHLIRFPDGPTFERLALSFTRADVPLNTETAGIWFSMLGAAGAVGDRPRLHEFTFRLKNASSRPFMVLAAVEAFFRGETSESQITSFLPLLPLPLEVTYALLERYPPPRPTAPPPKRA